MPSEAMRAELERLSAESRKTLAGADEIHDELSRLGGRMDDLGSSWTGQAAGAYLDVWREIQAETQDMVADLRWIAESLASTATAYGHTDASAADAVRGAGSF